MQQRPARGPTSARPDSAAELARLDSELKRLSTWQEGHEDHCAERYREVAGSIEGLRGDVGGIRSDIRRIHDVLLKGAPPAAGAEPRTRLEVVKDVVQIVFQIVGIISGLGVVAWVCGATFSALGAWSKHLSDSFPHH